MLPKLLFPEILKNPLSQSAGSGVYKYAVIDSNNVDISPKLIRVFAESVLSIDHANNLVVIKLLRGVRKQPHQQ